MTTEPRGIRNNNPGNVMHSARFTWHGEIEPDPDGYARFATMPDGIRAAAINLRTHFSREGGDTVRSLITSWAPPQYNPTAAYIAAVSSALGVEPDTPLSYDRPNVEKLLRAIFHFENGVAIDEAMLKAGLDEVFNSAAS